MAIRKHSIPKLLICIFIPLVVGIIALLLAGNVQNTYSALAGPSLMPPIEVFSIMWPILYVAMGVAFYLVLISKVATSYTKSAIILFSIQLAFNFLWSIVFFRYGYLGFSSLVAILLAIMIFICMIFYWRINKLAGILFAIYLLWILFVIYLNISFFILN